ncbi:MAG: Crp/Fnr family transcriptional regulator [Acidobacteria bacterium]|nr:Crp/Fnr family transcriptional regulator [Acidobacteriota bacterium]
MAPPYGAPQPMNADGFVTGNLVLGALPAHAINRLRPHLREVRLSKDEYLFQQDELIHNVYFPDTAVISEFQILEDGRMIEVATTGREGVIGVVSGFRLSRAVNCAQVCLSGRMLKISRDRLEREIENDMLLKNSLYAAVVQQMRQLSQKIICNSYHSVEQRFCSWLLVLSDRSDSQTLRITHEHVARVLGVHRPSITCIAQTIREKGIIEYSRGRLVLTDRKSAKRAACICYSDLALPALAAAGRIH